MKIGDFYKKVVRYGSELDPRKKTITSYPDTAILYGDPEANIKKVLIGIDIEVAELLLADKIRQQEGLDLVISHHPEGRAWAAFYEVMLLQIDLLVKQGISRRVAQGLLEERKAEVERRVLPNNHMRSVDAAKLLNIPFMCVHTPADNHAAFFIETLVKKHKPKKLSGIINILAGIPEYKDAADNSCGPRIILGNPDRPTGEIFVEMTGGTEGSKEAYSKLYKSGIRTLVAMHLSEEHFKKVKDVNLNVVIAGHISSDTLGINLLLDKIETKEELTVLSCSGFRRFERKPKDACSYSR